MKEYFPDKYGIETSLVDTADLQAVKSALRPNTKIVHIETPGNPTTRVSHIAEIAKLAHSVGALLTVDSTFASPFLQQPLKLGADLVIHSLTNISMGMAMRWAVL